MFRTICWVSSITTGRFVLDAMGSFGLLSFSALYRILPLERFCDVGYLTSALLSCRRVFFKAVTNVIIYSTSPSIIYSRFMSKTEVVHWRFDLCRSLTAAMSSFRSDALRTSLEVFIYPATSGHLLYHSQLTTEPKRSAVRSLNLFLVR